MQEYTRYGWLLVCSLLLTGVALCCAGALASVAARNAEPALPMPRVQYGNASWYGKRFHGRPTASGEIFHMLAPTAAHKKAPLGIHAIVTNPDNGHAVRVRINDRGPFKKNRIIDVSYGVARSLDIVQDGVVRVKVEFLPETLAAPPAFTVQVGAYHDLYRAVPIQKALAAYYPRVWTTLAQQGDQEFYCVRLGLFPTRVAAEQVARQVDTHGYSAAVVGLP